MPLTKQEKLKKLLAVANEDYVSVKQARELFKLLTDSIQKLKNQLKTEGDERKKELVDNLNQALKALKDTQDNLSSEVKDTKQTLKDKVSEELNRTTLKFTKEIEKIRKEIPEATDLTDIYNRLNALVIPTADEIQEKIEKNLPQYGELFRDGLELLQDDERLDISAIKGLQDEIKALRADISKKTSGGVRRVFQPHLEDFTADTDGVNKTFYLSREPLRTDTIEVHGTDFPIILRPTTDFTVTGKTLTLTDEVPAPSSGATLLIKFYS